jgi:hypothetical protein
MGQKILQLGTGVCDLRWKTDSVQLVQRGQVPPLVAADHASAVLRSAGNGHLGRRLLGFYDDTVVHGRGQQAAVG